MKRFIPAVRWIRSYEVGLIPGDLAGGLAVGSTLLPQGLASGQMVQVPPVAGLGSGIAAIIADARCGPSARGGTP